MSGQEDALVESGGLPPVARGSKGIRARAREREKYREGERERRSTSPASRVVADKSSVLLPKQPHQRRPLRLQNLPLVKSLDIKHILVSMRQTDQRRLLRVP